VQGQVSPDRQHPAVARGNAERPQHPSDIEDVRSVRRHGARDQPVEARGELTVAETVSNDVFEKCRDFGEGLVANPDVRVVASLDAPPNSISQRGHKHWI
jgi:hypothetical protein